MTSATILPSTGPPPPEIRRPEVPEKLRPKLSGSTESASAGPQGSSRAGSSGRAAPSPIARQLVREAKAAADAEVAKRTEPAGGRADGTGRTGRNNDPATTASQTGAVGRSQNLGGVSAVAVQVIESQSAPSVAEEVEEAVSVPPVENTELAGALSDEEKSRVTELKSRDREVRAHEAAHASAGQGYAGTPNFEYVTGPDGVQYAVGGHVSIDTRPVPENPEATIDKMEVVRRAALAPARPSGQDRAVASAAEAAIREAEGEIARNRREAAFAPEDDQQNEGQRIGAPEPEAASGAITQTSAAQESPAGQGFGQKVDQNVGQSFTPTFGQTPNQGVFSVNLIA